MTDPYYGSAAWKKLRAQRLHLDNYRCVICSAPAKVVDHKVRRKSSAGMDNPGLDGLRSLCDRCDRAVKEGKSGERGRGGVAPGCDASGMPLDPAHPWWCGTGKSEPSATTPGGTSIAKTKLGRPPLRGRAQSKLRRGR
jgi:hypothetical protein